MVTKKIVKKKKISFCEEYCECQWCNKSLKTIPKLNCCIAIILFVLNVCFPGTGTMLLGFSKGKNHFKVGVSQLLLSIVLIGWVLSIIWGLEILKISNSSDDQQNDVEMGDSNAVGIE